MCHPKLQHGTYTPFTEFPSPDRLARAQRDYAAANVERPLDENGIPLPFPPPTRKADVFRVEDYKDIDEHALRASVFMLRRRGMKKSRETCLSYKLNMIGQLERILFTVDWAIFY